MFREDVSLIRKGVTGEFQKKSMSKDDNILVMVNSFSLFIKGI